MTAGTSLDRMIGDYNMSDGRSSGGHDPSHMNANDFLAHVREHHTIGSHQYKSKADDRAKAVHELHDVYTTQQPRLVQELTDEFKKFKVKKHKDLCARIKQAYENNDKEPLNTIQIEEHLKDLADAILPEFKYGVTGEREKNYTSLKAYLAALNPEGSEEGKKLIDELYSAVRAGKGHKAARAVVKILEAHKTSHYFGQLESILFNKDDHDFRDAYAALIKKGVEDEVPDSELRAHSLATELEKAAKLYVNSDYVALAENYKLKKPPTKTHSSNAPAHH